MEGGVLMLLFLLACTESFEVFECEFDSECRESYGLGSKCMPDDKGGKYCGEASLPSDCTSYPAGLDGDWAEHASSPIIGVSLDRNSATISAVEAAFNHMLEQEAALETEDLAPVLVDCPIGDIDYLVETLGANIIVGPSAENAHAQILKDQPLVYLSPEALEENGNAPEFLWSMQSSSAVEKLSELILDHTENGEEIVLYQMDNEDSEEIALELGQHLGSERTLSTTADPIENIEDWQPSSMASAALFISDSKEANQAFVERIDALQQEGMSIPRELFLTDSAFGGSYSPALSFDLHGTAARYPDTQNIPTHFPRFASEVSSCADLTEDSQDECLEAAYTYEAIWLALGLELNARFKYENETNKIAQVLSGLTFAEMDGETHPLDEHALYYMSLSILQQVPYAMAGPTGPILFEREKNQRDPDFFEWSLEAVEGAGE
jgi:hypothetical protein